MELLKISRALTKNTEKLRFDVPITFAYNPLQYARRPHEKYLSLFGQNKGRVLLLGMNPGPWGMAQTGVPFGEVNIVRDWIGIYEPVDRPKKEHPKRPVEGFACRRSEISGLRLWGWARDRFKSPENFFRRFFIWNYCPLLFLEESGKNRTPDRLPQNESKPLFELCDLALQQIVEQLKPTWVIGVGAFAEKQARNALKNQNVQLGKILHPSPASPLANRGWAQQAEKELKKLGIEF